MNNDLAYLLEYKNPKLILRYEKDYPQAEMSAETALKELLKYIWLCCKHAAEKTLNDSDEDLNFQCLMYESMKEMDYMWHTFIIHTRDYQQFCSDYLNGHYFHHDPLSSDQPEKPEPQHAQQLRRYLSYIQEHLGEETLLNWFRV